MQCRSLVDMGLFHRALVFAPSVGGCVAFALDAQSLDVGVVLSLFVICCPSLSCLFFFDIFAVDASLTLLAASFFFFELRLRKMRG